MPDRRSFRRAPGRSMRRGTTWARLQFAAFTTIPAASKVLIATLVPSNPGITETVIRTVGQFMVKSDQSAGVEDQLGAFGFIVVTDLALAAGAASIPGPVTDGSDDGWFVWQPFSATGNAANPTGNFLLPFESKAARRIEEGFSVAVMCENAHATEGLDIAMGFSFLSKINT